MPDWLSKDFPLLSETERQEYEMLKKSAQWICICCGKPVIQRKVRFHQNVVIHEIDNGPYGANEYREAREDSHFKAKIMFQVDILRAEQMLAPFLMPEHREKVLAKLSI